MLQNPSQKRIECAKDATRPSANASLLKRARRDARDAFSLVGSTCIMWRGRKNGSLMWRESKGKRVVIKIGNLLRFLIPSSFQVVSWIARPVAVVAGDIVDDPHPEWMHKSDFIPCDCKKCFICINNQQTGIQHKKRKVTKTVFIQHDNSRTVQKGCTDKRVNLQRDNDYCKMCYRKLCAYEDEEIKKLDSKKMKRLCAKSRLGCPSCDEHICN
jgi:hypothetical protein